AAEHDGRAGVARASPPVRRGNAAVRLLRVVPYRLPGGLPGVDDLHAGGLPRVGIPLGLIELAIKTDLAAAHIGLIDVVGHGGRGTARRAAARHEAAEERGCSPANRPPAASQPAAEARHTVPRGGVACAPR